MADTTYSLCLVGIMDQLWFHQPILCTTQPINPLLSNPSIVSTDQDPCPDAFTDSAEIVSTVPREVVQPEEQYEDNCLLPEPSMLMDESDSKVKEEEGHRPTRVDLFASSRARSRSQSSPDRPRTKTFSGSKSLKKWTSCKNLEYLEMEEVKGLMDLGFVFRKEHLSPRMMSLVPGLQRLNLLYKKEEEEELELELSSEEEEEKIKYIERPYLSEAWLIRSPKSPLLNLHDAPKAEIKQHLKSWARSVAAVVEQES